MILLSGSLDAPLPVGGNLEKNGKISFFSSPLVFWGGRGWVSVAAPYPRRFLSLVGCLGALVCGDRPTVVWGCGTGVGGFREWKRSVLFHSFPFFSKYGGYGQGWLRYRSARKSRLWYRYPKTNTNRWAWRAFGTSQEVSIWVLEKNGKEWKRIVLFQA